MDLPTDRVYAESHEWHKLEGDILTLGLTQHAVDQLTDITYVEMKAVGTTIEPGDSVGEVESVKTTSDVYCAAAGEIIEVNPELDDNPGLLNEDPYAGAWLVKIRMSDRGRLDECVDAEKYAAEHAS